MIKISVRDAQSELPELLEKLGRGEDVVITEQDRSIVRVTQTIAFEAPAADEDLASFIARRRAALGMAATPPSVPDDFDWPTHEDDWLDNPRDPLNEGRLGA